MADISVMDQKRFSLLVERRALEPGISYMDAIIELCETHQIDLTGVKKYISKSLQSKVEAEAIELNYLKGGNTLPL